MPTFSLTVPNKNGSYDGDMVVANYTTLNISAGNILTVDQPCRGLLVYVQGDCTINGTLSMTARGANADPTATGGSDANAVDASGLRFLFKTASGSTTLAAASALLNGCGTAARNAIANHRSISANGTVVTVQRIGAAAASGLGCASGYAVTDGNNGTTGQSGSGGSGGRSTGGMYSGAGGGGAGSCFAGGAGGGGSAHSGSSSTCAANSQGGGNYGGAGGYATAYYGTSTGNGHTAGGGAGNPGGLASGLSGYGNANPSNGAAYADNGGAGCGGLLVLIVGGNLTIGASGSIQSNGTAGGKTNYSGDGSGGGGSGGGNIIICHRGSYTNNGSVTATGGAGGSAVAGQRGGNGGNGSVQVLQIK